MKDIITTMLPPALTFLAGLLAGWSIRVRVEKNRNQSTIQQNNKVGGDMAGRDVRK